MRDSSDAATRPDVVEDEALDGDDSSVCGIVNAEPLTKRLALSADGTDTFVGHPPDSFEQRVFGGQLLAQALLAAAETVGTEWVANSIHAYFVRQGAPTAPLEYAVTRVRDGRSFALRSVVAIQAERTLMTCSLLFNEARQIRDVVSIPAPVAPHPESLLPLHERRRTSAVPDGIKLPTRAHWWTACSPSA
jgi:acyl-CoA thioesterase II